MSELIYPESLKYLPDCYENATFEGASIAIINRDPSGEVPMDLTGAIIIMNIVRNEVVYKVYKTNDSSLLIDSNCIVIPEGGIDIPAGTYTFDFDITLITGVRLPGFAAGTWTILKP